MKVNGFVRAFAALLMFSLFGTTQLAQAQQGGDEQQKTELGVGLYLATCDSLTEGTALFALGDAELETDEFARADENEADAQTLEDELEQESTGDDTAVEKALGIGEDEDEGDAPDSDREVVVQENAPLVWVSTQAVFQADLVELVESPFVVAVRGDTQLETEGEDSFLACGGFGGAVAGNQMIIPLQEANGSGFSGIAILEQTGENESTASIYVSGGSIQDAAEATATPSPEPTPTPGTLEDILIGVDATPAASPVDATPIVPTEEAAATPPD